MIDADIFPGKKVCGMTICIPDRMRNIFQRFWIAKNVEQLVSHIQPLFLKIICIQMAKHRATYFLK